MLQQGDILAEPHHCDGEDLTPFAQAAFNTPFGRGYTKDTDAFHRSLRSWDAGGAPVRRGQLRRFFSSAAKR